MAVDTVRARASRVEQALLEAGALAVRLEDRGDEPLLEPPPGATPLWQAVRLVGLFDNRPADPQAFAQLAAALSLDELAQLGSTELAERDWDAEWRAALEPLQFGDRLWICPAGHDCPDPSGVRLELEPGLAFGTGTHPSTALCLDWLASQPLAGTSLLDFGCGSGILALAGLALGADRAVACDNDPQALLATRENARRNQLDGRMAALAADGLPATHYDVIIANILAGTLIRLAPLLARQAAPGAHLALSGILAEQAAEVIAAWSIHLKLEPWRQQEGWVLLSGRFGS
ncbi:MAG: 50S ribosomal protein L11 methyltransferase [Chromatiales bacterium]|nr:50S ribosomal protein L11 methyltransferase [Chromatiales bacterium]